MKKILLITCVFNITLFGFVYSQVDTLNINPEEQNINASVLSELHSEINNNKYGEVHSLLIVRNGQLVFEKYYNNYYRDRFHPLFSVTKTFTSALIGIAINQGKITSVDEYMLDFFPEYTNILNNDTLKKVVTLKHLLTMTAGFGNEDSLRESNNYIEYMLNRPMSFPPGEVWYYSNGSSMLLSGILQNRTGESAENFANTYLYTPLGIKDWKWAKGPNGLTDAAGGLQLRPLDMALFGQLYLQNGVWNGNQIVPKEWIDESIKVHVEYSKDDRSYGYQLWQFLQSSSVSQMLYKNDIFFASGSREQKIFVIPHLKCVVVMTSESAEVKEMLEKIISAINDRIPLINSTDDKN